MDYNAKALKLHEENGGKIAVVCGPALVHTGAAPSLARLIREGYVDVLLAGNAVAVHDIERQLFGTSLGMNCQGNAISDPCRAIRSGAASSLDGAMYIEIFSH